MSIEAHFHVPTWHEEHKAEFAPPICNRLMHKREMTVMCVPAPRSRREDDRRGT